MGPLKLYENWEKANYINRINRFTLQLEKRGGTIKAYLPNTGRIEEFLVEGGIFYITPVQTPKFQYRVISALYQDQYVLLDTIKMNDLIFQLIQTGYDDIDNLKREISFGKARIDFLLERKTGQKLVIEVKTCTLCHNSIALFPDAPSRRALHHLKTLHSLKTQGYEPSMMFIIPNRNAHCFMPNFHTDFIFSKNLLAEKQVHFHAYKVDLTDPVTVDLSSMKKIMIDYNRARKNCTPSGSYVLILKNNLNQTLKIGHLGNVFFRKGYFAYVGSALASVEARINRHQKKQKRIFWHIDYLLPNHMDIEKIVLIRRSRWCFFECLHDIKHQLTILSRFSGD
jgi:sugar fermentation stimulation protein A